MFEKLVKTTWKSAGRQSFKAGKEQPGCLLLPSKLGKVIWFLFNTVDQTVTSSSHYVKQQSRILNVIFFPKFFSSLINGLHFFCKISSYTSIFMSILIWIENFHLAENQKKMMKRLQVIKFCNGKIRTSVFINMELGEAFLGFQS